MGVAKSGSGFIIAADGRLLTNYHVVQYSKQATVRLANGDAYDTVEVIAVDKRKDIALLKVQAVELPYLPLGRSSAIEVGNTVFSVSSPLGLQNTLSAGIVSGKREMDGYRVFQISAPISHGSSGGPVFNAAGEVIGLTAFYIEAGQNLNFAIPIDYARGMMTSTAAPQTLASICEPEPTAPESQPAEIAATKPSQKGAASANVGPVSSGTTDALQQIKSLGVGLYLERAALRAWTVDDAKAVLGEPLRRRDGVLNNTVTSDIFAFDDPTKAMRQIEINFDRMTKKATHLFIYPWDLTWADCKRLWGENVKLTKNPNGTRFYAYQNRRLNVLITKDGKVISYGVY